MSVYICHHLLYVCVEGGGGGGGGGGLVIKVSCVSIGSVVVIS